VPKEFLPNRSRLEFSSLFGFQKNYTFVSYVSKKRKAVILLSTMHHAPNVTSDEIMKPKIVLDYNMTKGGVNTYDQMIHEYSSKRTKNRWPLAFFFNLLAVCTIWTEKNPNWNIKVDNPRSTFLKDLAENLINTEISRCKSNLVGV